MWVWRHRYVELGAREDIDYVFIFENRGVEVGVTLHHPHGQIYGYPFLPPVPKLELAADERLGGCAPCTLLERELADGRRVVHENDASSSTSPTRRAGPTKRTWSCARTAPACSSASRTSCVTSPPRCRRSCAATTRCSSARSPT